MNTFSSGSKNFDSKKIKSKIHCATQEIIFIFGKEEGGNQNLLIQAWEIYKSFPITSIH